MRSYAFALTVFLGIALSTPAWACPSCSCGDPTLTSMGTEQPFAGRLRLSATARAWSRESGTAGVDAQTLRELRMDLAAAWAPLPWLFLSAAVPLQGRELQDVSLAQETAWGLGDVELSGRLFLWRDRDFGAHHLISLLAGAKLPTAPMQHDALGAPLNLDTQLGTGSLDPFAGIAYGGFYSQAWSLYASATGYLPTRGYEGFRAGAQLRTTLAVQYQPSLRWALRVGGDARVEGAADLRGTPDASEAGFVGYLSPDLLWSPSSSLLLELGVRIPVIQRLGGPGREGLIVSLAIAYDP